MPGSSLWLVPPEASPLNEPLETLITETLPSKYPTPPPPAFSPHVTLTSEIPPAIYSEVGAQAWLESLPLPSGKDVDVEFDRVASEDFFFRCCYIKVAKDGKTGLGELASVCRRDAVLHGKDDEARQWLEESYMPHLSLMYSATKLDDSKVEKVEKSVLDAGVMLRGRGGPMGGWRGGIVWLVPTDRPIAEWKPIAVRQL